jgi:hypothetical protein
MTLTKRLLLLQDEGEPKTTNLIEKEDVMAKKKNSRELDKLQASRT